MYELAINLKSDGRIPLYEQIYEYIRSEIRDGHIASGEKLPSTRALSRCLDVSRSTVELAYEQLLSEGYIEPSPAGDTLQHRLTVFIRSGRNAAARGKMMRE